MDEKSSSDESYSLDLQLDNDWTNDDTADEEMMQYLNPAFSTESDTGSEKVEIETESKENEQEEEEKLDSNIQDQFVSINNIECNCVPKCNCAMTSQITYL